MDKLIMALVKANIPIPNKGTETCGIVRWGKNNRYWLRKFQGGYIFGDFVTGLSDHVFDHEYKGQRLKQVLTIMEKTRQATDQELMQIHKRTAQKAQSIFDTAHTVSSHPYLSTKKVLSHGLKEYKGCLLIPLRDVEGKLWSLQFIDKNSEKRFLSGGKKKGCFFLIGTLGENAFVCEGYATGATIYECTAVPTVVAFDAGNLESVVQALRKQYPNLKMILCADNDCYGEANVGVEKANAALKEAGAKRVVPLPVSGGFHSKLMEEASVKFSEILDDCEIKDAEIPVYTNVDAEPTTSAIRFKAKMTAQIYSSVMWTQTIQRMAADGVDTIVEIGPGKVLAGLIKKTDASINVLNIFDEESLNNAVSVLNEKFEVKCL